MRIGRATHTGIRVGIASHAVIGAVTIVGGGTVDAAVIKTNSIEGALDYRVAFGSGAAVRCAQNAAGITVGLTIVYLGPGFVQASPAGVIIADSVGRRITGRVCGITITDQTDPGL